MDLPIHAIEADLDEALSSSNRFILTAPTGSGKSTRLPGMILNHEKYRTAKIIVLQPRRLAARMLAARVAEEFPCRLGEQVGYHIRFDRKANQETQIEYVTEGILLRRLLSDPNLSDVDVVLLDEFHERNLFTDLSLASLKQLQETRRPELLIGIMSATLAVERLASYFEPCSILRTEGRTYPVTIEYLAPPKNKRPGQTVAIWDQAVRAFEKVMAQQPEGDVLVFMPGRYEIQRTVEALKHHRMAKGMRVLPLHGEMASHDQDDVLGGSGQRKIVVATNVAETSLTIPGIRIVIDAGWARVARFDPCRGINILNLDKISKAAADQRAGRAGRIAEGHCIRCWSETEHKRRLDFELPEIHRVDLCESMLTLMASGLDLGKVDWFEPPSEEAMGQAVERLRDLGAMNRDDQLITSQGLKMASFPVHPRFARMLLEAAKFECVQEVALCAAIESAPPLLIRNPGGEVKRRRQELLHGQEASDFEVNMTLWQQAQYWKYSLDACRGAGIHAGNARTIGRLFDQFLQLAKRQGLALNEYPANERDLRRCLLTGLVDHLAVRKDQGSLRCRLIHNRHGDLDKETVVQKAQLLVAGELQDIERKGKPRQIQLSMVAAIEESWLAECFPDAMNEGVEVVYDSSRRLVGARKVKRFKDLVLEEKLQEEVPLDEASKILAEEIFSGRLVLKSWDQKVAAWTRRLNLIHEQMPELQLPQFTQEDYRGILEMICYGATRYKEVKERSVWPTLESWYGAGVLSAVKAYAPLAMTLSNGKNAKIKYDDERGPKIALRIQELYDVKGQLTLPNTSIPVLVEFLAPNYRPVHTSADLDYFWSDVYAMAKKDLKGRYPKHEWR